MREAEAQAKATVQELKPAAPLPPVTPAAPGQAVLAPSPGGDPLALSTPQELAKLTYRELQARLSALRDQRSELASRREALASGYEGATGANQAGIGARLLTLDNNIVMYEKEIAAVGRAAAAKAGERAITISPDGSPNGRGGYTEDDIAGAVFGTFLGTALVAVFLARRFVRRRVGRMAMGAQPNMLQSNERLDRIENAVDSIAVEIERVSENQRFMTRLMTETQLGDTLKDVRKSTELAKNAASDA